MSLVLDAGAFLAVERGDRHLAALLKGELLAGTSPITHGGVIAQIWRGGSGRQAPVARLLPALEIRPVDEDLGRRAGILLGRSGTSDVVDAAIVLVASDGDRVLTSDVGDLRGLAEASAIQLELIPV